jgi:hypothetical protein
MGLPRSKYVQEGREGVYHCFSRCVRRAFLFGFDKTALRDFSHRKAWLVERLRHLANIFAIDVCAYAVMETHYHVIARLRPDIVAMWSDREVAVRWLTLFPGRRATRSLSAQPTEEEICSLAGSPERIGKLRTRLCSLSWFMGRLNEFIARTANHEDGVTGRFWESRFKCQALLDEAAIASCMVYVDLNPIRAGVAATPEASDFTSIQERIRAWQKENVPVAGERGETAAQSVEDWLCPIESKAGCRGILQMTAADYLDLVDQSGRITRSDKRGAIEDDIAPILLRIGANPDSWHETISRFGCKFRLAAGLYSNMRDFAARLGRRWLHGAAAARDAFVSGRQQLA